MGWQRQAHGPSVQQAIEEAVTAVTQTVATVHAAGRTDAGVHAEAMAAHLDLARPITPFRLMEALNARLRPAPVAILACEAVPDDWHARFSCVARRYRYRIVNRRAPLALEEGRAWQVAVPLDADAMDAAARVLEGRHDFTTFRSAHCQADSPVRTLDRLRVRAVPDAHPNPAHPELVEGCFEPVGPTLRQAQGERIQRSSPPQVIEIEAAARSFLHHQVRSMVGCLVLVGREKWRAADLAAALAARDRAALGLNAPPDGLYFVEASY